MLGRTRSLARGASVAGEKLLKRAWKVFASPEAIAVLTIAALVLQVANEIEKLRRSRRPVGFLRKQ